MNTTFRRCWSALLACAAAAFAADFAALKPQGYVSDFAGVVDRASRDALEKYAARVEQATGVQMAFVTLPTLGGEPVEDVANLLFRKWGVGAKGTNEGILLLLVTGERKSRLEVGYGLEPVIPDGYAGSLLREMRPALRAGDYGEALGLAARNIAARVAAAKGVALDTAEAPVRRQRPVSNEIPWPVILGGLGLLVWLLMSGGGAAARRDGSGGVLPALLLGHMMGGGSRWAGRGGGGFGGYDSFDRFGGFGGGDSGGGGASSNW